MIDPSTECHFQIRVDDVKSLVAKHAPDDASQARLEQLITNTLLPDLEIRYRYQDQFVHEGREARREYYRNFQRALSSLAKLCSPPDPTQRIILRRLFAEELASCLTSLAFLRTHEAYRISFSLHDLHRAEIAHPEYMYDILEDLARNQRRLLAAHAGEKVLYNFLIRLEAIIVKQLSLDKGTPGNPGNPYRSIVLSLLAKNYQWVFGEPLKSPSKLLRLAEDTLLLFGLSTDGLDDAVKRTLRAYRRRTASA